MTNLGGFGFQGGNVSEITERFSGSEKARLAMVSHDRHLLRATTDDFYLVHDG